MGVITSRFKSRYLVIHNMNYLAGSASVQAILVVFRVGQGTDTNIRLYMLKLMHRLMDHTRGGQKNLQLCWLQVFNINTLLIYFTRCFGPAHPRGWKRKTLINARADVFS